MAIANTYGERAWEREGPIGPSACNTAIEKYYKRCIDAETRWYIYLILKSSAKDDPWALFLSPAEFGDAALRQRAEQRIRLRQPTLKGSFGNFLFENIQKYRPDQYRAALAAQDEYAKVASFLPYYKKITNAVPEVSIGLARHGVGHLVFSMNRRGFMNLVEDQGIRKKVNEMIGEAVLEMVFDAKWIGILGLGLQILEIARGIENDKMLGASGKPADEWRRNKKLQFIFGIVAEDIRRRQGGDARVIANNLAARYKQFQPIFQKYTIYTTLEDDLRRFQGKIPDRISPVIRSRD